MLDDLPSELLVKITKSVVEEQRRQWVAYKSALQSLRAVSSVSHRLRDANLPLLFRHMVFNSWEELADDAIPLFSDAGKYELVARYVRFVVSLAPART